MIEVPLTQGKVALIDDEDAERVLAYKWTALSTRKPGRWYARRSVWIDEKSTTIYLHRFIANAPREVHIDHRNGDGLDNRKENLRIVTNAQNHQAAKVKAGKTGFRGVCVSKSGKRFHARLSVSGQKVYRNGFLKAEEAARAYDELAKQYHGEFATLNFPDEVAHEPACMQARGNP